MAQIHSALFLYGCTEISCAADAHRRRSGLKAGCLPLAIEDNDLHHAAKQLGRLKAKASKGRYLMHNMPQMWAYDNEAGS